MYSKQIVVSHLCLLSIGVFACFSYPLRYPFVAVIIAYGLAKIKSKEVFILPIKVLGKIMEVVLIGIVSMLLVKDIRFEKHWGKLVQKAEFDKTEQLLNSYEQLFSRWNGDPMFLYNYGAVLNKAEQYVRSNEILTECAEYFNDYDVQMIIADNYSKLEQWDKAETHYIFAHNMIPNRFIPLYRLMILYDIIGNKKQLLEMANIIINKTIKVSSATISYIQNQAQNVVNSTLQEECNSSFGSNLKEGKKK